MVNTLLLEIGTEEIPAGFLKNAADNLKIITGKFFLELNLEYTDITVFYTPRRIILKAQGIPDKQSDFITSIVGPPKRISYDENGNPTNAAIGFAKKQNVSVKDLSVIINEKGEFLCLKKVTKGKKSNIILKDILPDIIFNIPFPKSMRWLNTSITFARPIRWILCIFNNKKINMEISGIKSSDKTFGHRFLHPKKLTITSWEDYLYKISKASVIIDQEERKSKIELLVQKIAKDLGGYILQDKHLLETVTNIVEYPVVQVGTFSDNYLEIPEEVLVSVMKTHQKYFPVYIDTNSSRKLLNIRSLNDIKDKNKLLPYFIFVSGIKAQDPTKIINGNEKVIKARFSDARFFLEEDTKHKLEENNEKLKSVTYLSDIGSYYDKILRLEKLAKFIVKCSDRVDTSKLERAASLSKADLVSQMVYEFPELQGVIGKYYALLSHEDPVVALAIEEHYMPLSRDGELPISTYGALLSIIDKIDNICSCFCAGFIPSGTADPYALRRQSIGIINILIKHEINLGLMDIINFNLDIIGLKKNTQNTNLSIQISDFIIERFRHLLLEMNYSADVVEAVISVNSDDIVESKKIIQIINEFKQKVEFDSVTIAFKRVVNIVKDTEEGEIDQSLLSEISEKRLYEEYLKLKEYINRIKDHTYYDEMLNKLILLRIPIDNFFDNVLVMDNNPKIKSNRLQLLLKIKNLFFKVADFSKLN